MFLKEFYFNLKGDKKAKASLVATSLKTDKPTRQLVKGLLGLICALSLVD